MAGKPRKIRSMRPHARFRLLRMLCLASLLAPFGMARALEPVTLQLKWTHAFQFAGYYAAVEQGYYRDVGLDVRLLEATPGIDPLDSVLSGRAQFGVGNSNLLLARHAGKPVVVLAAVFQHSPLVLIARQGVAPRGTQGIHDLIGKRVMIEPQSDELIAYLKQEGIDPARLVLRTHSFEPDDLIEGRVDAISAYVSNEPYYLDHAGLAYQIYTPRSVGIDFYGDNLFTTDAQLRAHPARVAAFRAASLRGWEYAMRHPEEIADLILAKYSRAHPRDFYLYEAQRMANLLRTDLIEVGYMNPGRWRHIADTYASLGLLPPDTPLDDFLYAPDTPTDLTPLYVALALLASVSGIALLIYRMNRRLARALDESRAAEARIRHLATHDPLTDLPNRTLFSDRLAQALAHARRDRQQLAVLFIDMDNFKPVNDAHGHDVGDHLLQEMAQRLRAGLRESDTVARMGGDEFIVLVRNVTDGPAALAVAGKLAEAIARPFVIDGHRFAISASIGVALYPAHGERDTELLRHADEAMYAAKQSGRHQVRLFAPD